MCSILLSINPCHVEKIMSGKKIYEFRKKACKKQVDKILIYSTTPVMKVVGEADIEAILVDSPGQIWKITKKKSGIDKTFFDEYFSERDQAVAYKLKNIIQYSIPKDLNDFGIKTAPQSFQYVYES